MGETIKVSAKDGGAIDAYLAKPPSYSGAVPGVIIIQEAFGVTPWIKAISDRFAAEGYLVAAPDFYWRFAPNFAASFDDEEAVAAARRNGRACALALKNEQIDENSSFSALRTRPLPKSILVDLQLGPKLNFWALP